MTTDSQQLNGVRIAAGWDPSGPLDCGTGARRRISGKVRYNGTLPAISGNRDC